MTCVPKQQVFENQADHQWELHGQALGQPICVYVIICLTKTTPIAAFRGSDAVYCAEIIVLLQLLRSK